MVCTKCYNFGKLWEITHEPSQLELSFLYMTLLPNTLYNLTKFHENNSKGIGFMSHTRFCLQTDGRMDRQMDGWTDGCPGNSYIPGSIKISQKFKSYGLHNLTTIGDNSRKESVRVVLLVVDTPNQCHL